MNNTTIQAIIDDYIMYQSIIEGYKKRVYQFAKEEKYDLLKNEIGKLKSVELQLGVYLKTEVEIKV